MQVVDAAPLVLSTPVRCSGLHACCEGTGMHACAQIRVPACHAHGRHGCSPVSPVVPCDPGGGGKAAISSNLPCLDDDPVARDG